VGEKGNVVATAEAGVENFGDKALSVTLGVGEAAGETLRDKVIEKGVDHGLDETRERFRRDPEDSGEGGPGAPTS
jgi:hypothetical protein